MARLTCLSCSLLDGIVNTRYKAQAVMAKALDFQDAFLQEFQYLWTDSIDEYMESFLKYGRVPTDQEQEEWRDENPDKPFPLSPPTLDQFKEAIDKCVTLTTLLLY